MDKKEKTAWVVWVNSDGTEGRGPMVVEAVCETKATALRLAKGRSTQGSNGEVFEVPIFERSIGNSVFAKCLTYAPVTIKPATPEDRSYQRRIDQHNAAREKALASGLTDEDIKALRGA